MNTLTSVEWKGEMPIFDRDSDEEEGDVTLLAMDDEVCRTVA